MALGQRIAIAREKRGLNQVELAALVYGNDDPNPQAKLSALETRDSVKSEKLFKFADVLKVRARWLQDGVRPSGLEENIPASGGPDRLLEQLINLWGQLDADRRDAVLSFANKMHAEQYPLASPSNPFGASKRKRQKAKQTTHLRPTLAHTRADVHKTIANDVRKSPTTTVRKRSKA